MTDFLAPEAPPLPLWRSVAEAYSLTARNLRSLGRLAWLWLIVLLVVLALADWLIWPFELASRTGPISTVLALSMLPYAFELLVGASIAVAWHRRLLLEESEPSTAYFRLDRTVMHYFLWVAVLILLALAPVHFLIAWFEGSILPDGPVGSNVAEPGFVEEEELEYEGTEIALMFAFSAFFGFVVFLIVALLSYLPTRLIPILPAIALGHRHVTIRIAWNSTRRTFWRLFLGMCLAAAPMLIIIVAVAIFVGEPSTFFAYVSQNSAVRIVELLVGIISVSYFSVVYRFLFDLPRTVAFRSESAENEGS